MELAAALGRERGPATVALPDRRPPGMAAAARKHRRRQRHQTACGARCSFFSRGGIEGGDGSVCRRISCGSTLGRNHRAASSGDGDGGHGIAIAAACGNPSAPTAEPAAASPLPFGAKGESRWPDGPRRVAGESRRVYALSSNLPATASGTPLTVYFPIFLSSVRPSLLNHAGSALWLGCRICILRFRQ